MEIPIVRDPMQRGRQILSNLSPIKRPDFVRPDGPVCPECKTALSENMRDAMEVHGIKYCPVCVLDDVHPFADPQNIIDISSSKQIKSVILDVFDTPPSEVREGKESLPGVYILWSPARQENLDTFIEFAGLGKFFTRVLNAAKGNGLLYIGESQNVAHRVWEHTRRNGAILTAVMPPTKLVAVNWKAPQMSLSELEEQVGRQVARAVSENGYDMEVYWD